MSAVNFTHIIMYWRVKRVKRVKRKHGKAFHMRDLYGEWGVIGIF